MIEHVYEKLGQMLRDARERVGLEQEELAERLGLGQQAISAWERGRSRPRRTALGRVADVLQLDIAALVDEGKYRPAAPSIALPPLSRFLPIDELPPERFEDFVAVIMQSLYPDGHATLFGGQGDKQFGIDILVTGEHNKLATAQCKRHKKFGPAAVKSAVSEMTIDAPSHYLFLSRRTATPGARSEIAEYSMWQLWDGSDIARYIQGLPAHQALRIVDTYFPGHRETFLGIPQPGPWLPAEEYFVHGQASIYTHDWDLVGRVDEVGSLVSALFVDGPAVAALVGRGGIGKTRLLRSLGEAAPSGFQVRFLSGDAPVAAADFELLPADGPLAVLLDDAHDRIDLSFVIAGIRRRNSAASLLIATRPYGWDRLRTDLARAGEPPADPVVVELNDLALLDAEALAREALGDAHAAAVQRLAYLTRDCPLLTVVGGVLIRRGSLDLSQLPNDDAARDVIFRGFRDALVADPTASDPETRGAVLDAVAALQPFRTNEEPFKDAMSALVGKPFDVLNKHLRSLEDAGILRRRGTALRIIPDLLGDVVLVDACYDSKANAQTGYLDRVRNVVEGLPLQNLIVNASRVDWQVRHVNADSPSLVEALWAPLENELKAADILGREQLVKLLTRAAFFQPDRILHIARWLIDNPTDRVAEEHEVWSTWRKPTYGDVLSALPAMLKNAAYTFDTLRPAAEMLWELAQDDLRPTNQFPEHPLRILNDLAEYEIGKPVIYNEEIVSIAADRWFIDGQALSPFKVLEPLLATEGSRSTYQDYAIRFQPFSVNIDVVGPIRRRVVDLALAEASAGDLRRAVAGVRAVESALRYPSGMYGRPVTEAERDGWTPEFNTTIRRLGEIGGHPLPDPVVGVAIRQTLHWHSTYSRTDTRPVAETVVGALPGQLEDRIALIIHDGWGSLIHDREDDYAVAQQKIEHRLAQAASDLAALADTEIIEILDRRLTAEQVAFGPRGSGHPGPLVARVIDARPSLAPKLIDLIDAGDHPMLDPLLPVILSVYADSDTSAALTRARQLLETSKTVDARRSVAQGFGANRSQRQLEKEELELLLEFAADSDEYVQKSAVFVVQRVAKTQPVHACQLLTAIDFSNSSSLADEVLGCFSEQHYGLSWKVLSGPQKTKLRERLVRVPDLNSYWVSAFLANRSAEEPRWVIEVLQDRVTLAEELDSLNGYNPLPFHWDNSLRVREHSSFAEQLQYLHAWLADKPDSLLRREFGAELFEAVAGRYDEPVLTVLAEALDSPNVADVQAVAAVVRKAHRTLIWDAPEFVVQALHAADRLGEEFRSEMASAFWSATITGGRSGAVGQPYPEDIEQRDESTRVAESLAKGSIEEDFYRAMVRSAEQSISRSALEDLHDDGRDW